MPRSSGARGYSSAPELIRILKLGGVGQNLQKVATLNVAPLIGKQVPGPSATAWTVIRPSAYLLLAVDPDKPFNTPESIERERVKLLDEIKDVLKSQGVERPNPDELDHLIEVRVWNASCYDFAHFTDDELADGIIAMHPTISGWIRDELVTALGYWRAKDTDIKRVWTSGRIEAASSAHPSRPPCRGPLQEAHPAPACPRRPQPVRASRIKV